jgi:uncharacterized protein
MIKFVIGSISGLAVAGFAIQAMAQQQFISIGTGGVTGVYYPAGGAICRLVNKDRKEHGIRCSAESTGGSVYNVNTIRAGELEFGVVQSDIQFHAQEGSGEFTDKFEGLRAVFSLHPEPVTIMALPDSGIDNISDFAGKRVNIGNPGSGTRGTWETLEEAGIVSTGDLSLATELKSAEMAQSLCDGRIDAFFWLVGHPSASTQEAMSTCDAKLVHATGPGIDELVAERPYYRHATIPAGTYPGQDEDINTFGVGATFVTSADVPEEVVYTLVKAVFENFDDLKNLHPALANLKEEEMIRDSLTAPLHAGAEKYYKERGWM